jgi:malate dehydrogenase
MTASKRFKIALVGSGNIGGTLAHLALQRRLGDVVMIDVAEGIPQGKGLDLSQGSAIDGIENGCLGSNDAADMVGADVVIVTAGVPRKPGMSRDDLLAVNAGIVRTVGGNIKKYCPKAFVIVVTNPLDVMVWLMQKASGLPTTHVVGMAGVLDSGRYIHFLATEMNVSPADIQAFVLGGHGDSMVPVPRYTTIAGIPLKEWIAMKMLSEERLDQIIDRTRNGGAEIVNLLKTGSAFYAPASAALTMAESYLFNQRRILPCAVHLNGEYGISGMYVGVPAIIGEKGVEKVLELSLEANEKSQFDASVQAVQKLMEDVARLGL